MNPEEKHKQEKFFIEESPDKIGDSIEDKLEKFDFKSWQVERIKELVESKNFSLLFSNLEKFGFDLLPKEKEHFKKVPVEIVLSWFKKHLDIKEKKDKKEE